MAAAVIVNGEDSISLEIQNYLALTDSKALEYASDELRNNGRDVTIVIA